jgi:hypothetical protein
MRRYTATWTDIRFNRSKVRSITDSWREDNLQNRPVDRVRLLLAIRTATKKHGVRELTNPQS